MSDIVMPDSEVFQRFLAAADEGNFDSNPEQAALDIIARILDAKTAYEVLAGHSATSAGDYLGRPFTLTAVRFNQSRFEGDGPQFFAVLEGATPDGENVVITCGAKNVIAQAWKLSDLGALPIVVTIEQSPNPTANGYHVMWLEAAPSF